MRAAAWILVGCVVFGASAAQAVDVDLDPGTYSGNWQIFGVTGLLSGPQTIEDMLGRGVTLAEVTVPPRSRAVGKSLRGRMSWLQE